MKKRIISMFLAMMISSAMLSGCGKQDRYATESAAYDGAYMNSTMAKSGAYDYEAMSDEAVEYEEDYEMESTAGESGSSIVTDTGESPDIAVNSTRKLIRTVDLTVEALDYEKLMADIKQRVNALGGYFENMDESGDARKGSVRYANMTIRIPKANADELISVVENESNITNRSENITDVTLDYSDRESHKKVLLAEQERLLAMMEQAETIEEMITIESRLSDVRYQIESMESQLRTYDNKIDYTTIYLRVNEVEKITPVEEPTFLTRISEGFSESCQGAIDFVKDVVAWFIINSPYLVLWAIGILIFVFLILKPMLRKAKVNGEKMRREREELMIRRAAAQSGNYIPAPEPAIPEDKPAKTKKGFKVGPKADPKAGNASDTPESPAEPAPEAPQTGENQGNQ